MSVQAMDLAKQAKVAEVLGPDFISRGRSSARDSSLFSPTDTVSYEKLNHGREDEVHLGLDFSRDSVWFSVCICLLDCRCNLVSVPPVRYTLYRLDMLHF